jgi:nickel-type superoxide dismutase maturation protease
MIPTLAPGDRVLVDLAAYRRVRPLLGDVVLARHPFRRGVRVVKRVVEVDAEGHCLLVGDNPMESTDGRSFGSLPGDHVLGRVVLRLG